MNGKMLIRLAQIDDLPLIVDIYNQSIPSKQSTGDTQPLQVEDRLTWFREHGPEEHPIFVAEADRKVVGWCSLSAYRPGRAALRFTSEISYYIDYRYHRQGIATALVEHALAACPALGIRHVFAIVLEGNKPVSTYWRKWALNSGAICRGWQILMVERWGISIMGGIWIKSGSLSIVKSSCGRDNLSANQ